MSKEGLAMTMNILKRFNLAMDYIESNLDSRIDENEIYNITTYSYGVFARVFSVLSGLPLGEYIRNRRLSKAAIELKSKKNSVTDIFFKYGYSSPEAFSYAFKRFHGVSPIDVIKGRNLEVKIFPLMKFSVTAKGGEDYKITLRNMNHMDFIGLTKKISPEMMKQEIWEEMLNELRLCDPIFCKNKKIYGMFYIDKEDNDFRYTLGYLLEENSKKYEHLTKISVDANEYAVVEIKGNTPSATHGAWEYLVGSFLPEESLAYSGDIDFEVFSNTDKGYNVELWVPVKPVLE